MLCSEGDLVFYSNVFSNSCILTNNSNTFTFRAIFYCSSETISKTVDLAGERCAVENMFCINLVSFIELKCYRLLTRGRQVNTGKATKLSY